MNIDGIIFKVEQVYSLHTLSVSFVPIHRSLD